jgi:MFS family permease
MPPGLARRRPAVRFAGLGIPERGRGQFIAAAVAAVAFAAFALLGLFSSLVPGFIGGVLHQGSHAVQGAAVFGLFAIGTITQVALSRLGSRPVVLAGLGVFLAALALILTALAQASMALFLAGTVAGGVSVGAVFGGSLATASRLAPPERRGHVVSTFFVACYAGLIIPVVGVGAATEFIATFPAVLAFSLLLAAACLFSLARIATALSLDGA